MSLLTEIAETEAKLAELKARAGGATCAEVGHRVVSQGGANACCELGKDCDCSVAVMECEVCGACDYGEADKVQTHDRCAKRQKYADYVCPECGETGLFWQKCTLGGCPDGR